MLISCSQYYGIMSDMVQIIIILLAMSFQTSPIMIFEFSPQKLMIFLIVLPQPGSLGGFEVTNIAQIFHFLVHSQNVAAHVPLVPGGGFTLITSICQDARIFFSLLINFLLHKFLLLHISFSHWLYVGLLLPSVHSLHVSPQVLLVHSAEVAFVTLLFHHFFSIHCLLLACSDLLIYNGASNTPSGLIYDKAALMQNPLFTLVSRVHVLTCQVPQYVLLVSGGKVTLGTVVFIVSTLDYSLL